MMNQQPDKLFQEKLSAYTRPVSSNAWNRIENRLDKKNNRGLWLKVAAAILLLAVAAFILWPAKEDKILQRPLAKKQPEQKISPVDVPKASLPEKEPIASVTPLKKESKEKSAKNKKPLPNNQSQASEKIAVAQLHLKEQREAKEVEIEKENAVEQVEVITENKTTLADNNTTVQTPGVTLIYSAEEVNEKYLNKKSLAEATSEEKKPSTLRKLLDKAYDLKHNQDPFGDLRQKKNEILALNFKNEKQRSQNK
jgi:hypothetical protein